MDEMDVSDALREFVVADIVGGQYQCDGCFPDGCGPNAAEHILSDGGTWHPKSLRAQDAWDQPISRLGLIREIATRRERPALS
ncbi:MAG: hypothetical protein QGG34_05550 [SAR202 cluster bacterium]|jgi:hypothetical protein|nr:hypothetical protein [SAR202 cluster bacterium]MDP6300025.1 hypothetical protein [SAR202 cluster bacterium]MDP7224442.1 hypothetical protein [SAR202 cluster bacterium]MDP7413139.1 hypothetical protein [SAR202 cluster bacterium]HJO80879.1 hypothetical protein [SAR202 cluster bacterium]